MSDATTTNHTYANPVSNRVFFSRAATWLAELSGKGSGNNVFSARVLCWLKTESDQCSLEPYSRLFFQLVLRGGTTPD